MKAFLLTILTLALCCQAAFAQKTNADWRAGVAKAVITPDQPVWMAGYGSRTKPSEGTSQELYAKALALQDNRGKRVVIVTTDILGIPREMGDAIASGGVRAGAGALQAAAILTFAFTMIRHLRR
jgi:hypothetical protein